MFLRQSEGFLVIVRGVNGAYLPEQMLGQVGPLLEQVGSSGPLTITYLIARRRTFQGSPNAGDPDMFLEYVIFTCIFNFMSLIDCIVRNFFRPNLEKNFFQNVLLTIP